MKILQAIALFFLFLSLVLASEAQATERARRKKGSGGTRTPCAGFVYLKDGKFMLGANPYRFKGVNFHFSIGGRVLTRQNDKPKDWEYFLTPYSNYFPSNNGVCREQQVSPPQCCDSRESCQQLFEQEHVFRLSNLGVNNVRLVDMGVKFDSQEVPYLPCDRVWDSYSQSDWDQLTQQERDDHYQCRIELSTPEGLQTAIGILRRGIDTLGFRGIRSILLTGDRAGIWKNLNLRSQYLSLLSQFAAAFKTDPFLIAYDPYNEPLWNPVPDFFIPATDPASYASLCDYGDLFCKNAAQVVSKQWFDALTGPSNDPNHLVTIGVGDSGSLATWDPYMLYDHFTSYHIYPPSPWDGGEVIHGSRMVANDLYAASLGACGEKCPFVGEFDGANCFVGAGPLTSEGFIWRDGFYYHPLPGADPCPIGYYEGPDCKVGLFELGRDTPFILQQPFFYVEPSSGQCPAGTTFDGANCQVAVGPPGVTGFIFTANGVQNFYYTYIDPNGERCQPPAYDDGANCLIAAVPVGYNPFIVYRPLYYVKATRCGPKKPVILGETGFTTFPNGTDLDPANYTFPPQRWQQYQDDCDPLNSPSTPGGTEDEQIEYLFGNSSINWPGVFPYTHLCGLQGLQWWLFGSLHWGDCAGDQFGLHAFWYAKMTTTTDPNLLVRRPIADRFQSELNYLTPLPAGQKCARPSDFSRSVDRQTGTSNYRYHGRALKAGIPAPNVLISVWELLPDNSWRAHQLHTNSDGEFALNVEECLVEARAADFGYDSPPQWVITQCPGPPTGSLQHVYLSDIDMVQMPKLVYPATDLQTPSTPKRACYSSGVWILQ
ncbi:MAG TPA: hypothetical protein VI895_08675 [Bdellovibrionota bacterium]|nr:hypothetical protein [Bdellovibrionota bacterium]